MYLLPTLHHGTSAATHETPLTQHIPARGEVKNEAIQEDGYVKVKNCLPIGDSLSMGYLLN